MTRCLTCQQSVGDDDVCPDCGTTVTPDQPATAATPGRQRHPTGTQQRHQPDTKRSRNTSGSHPLPTGLKIVCAVFVLSGAGSLWVGNVLREMSATAVAYGASQAAGMKTIGLVVALLGVGQLGAAVGLWTRNAWGWTATVVVTAAGTVTGLWWLTNRYTATLGFIVLLVNAGIGWYVYAQRWRFRSDPRQRQKQHTAAGRQRNRDRNSGNS